MESSETNLIIIAGLPGSGKTTFGKHLAKILNYSFIDDLDLTLQTTLLPAQFFEQLNEGHNFVVTEPKGVLAEWRTDSRYALAEAVPNLKTYFIFFTNESDICLKNAENREGKSVTHYITYLSKYYTVEPNSPIISCWR